MKRCGFGQRRFEHYRLRVLLHAGAVTLATRAITASHPNRAEQSNAKSREPQNLVGREACGLAAAIDHEKS